MGLDYCYCASTTYTAITIAAAATTTVITNITFFQGISRILFISK